jgi:predicted DNA-binding transcriptional regulator AlpA
MKEILGVQYMTDKEAAVRYGYSQSWFRQRRYDSTGPQYVRLKGKGKAWYPLKETDEWFKKNMVIT